MSFEHDDYDVPEDDGPPELPELHELPTLPGRVYGAYLFGVCAAVLAGCWAATYGLMVGNTWAVVTGGLFLALAVSQALAYLWRREAWESHSMTLALCRVVVWVYGSPEVRYWAGRARR